ncbi:MAG: AEC family transporter [Alcaligenaceae bacterium]|nr:AEC family transporter [Alcaligenaceae bacterium]
MSVFQLILPDFLLIGLGWLLFRKLNFKQEFFKGAEQLVYFVLFPALLFHSITQTRLDLDSASLALQSTVAVVAAGIVLSALAMPLLKPPPMAYASVAQCGYRFNTYIGLSLSAALGGAAGQTLMALMVGIAVPLVNMAAVRTLARQSGGNVLGEIVRNPFIIATVVGLAWNMLGLPVPDVVAITFQRLGSAALALGLICVGASLTLEGLRGMGGLMSWIVAVRLLMLPLVALVLAWLLDVPDPDRQILLLFAALPTASSTYVLAARMGGDGRLVSITMTAGTLLSALTIPFWLIVSTL